MKFALLALLIAAPAAAQTAAAQAAATPPVLTGTRFEQVALTVGDLNAARRFYRDQLGLTLLFEAGGMLFFDVGGTRLMLAADPARQPPPRPTGILYFHTDDFAAAHARLTTSGARLVGAVETVQQTPKGTLRLQQFEDPDGNMLAIMGFVVG